MYSMILLRRPLVHNKPRIGHVLGRISLEGLRAIVPWDRAPPQPRYTYHCCYMLKIHIFLRCFLIEIEVLGNVISSKSSREYTVTQNEIPDCGGDTDGTSITSKINHGMDMG
jgi:hypothetical protein